MMPIRMRRKTRGMEKVENLYCTARAQHVMPRRRDHVVGSGGANRFKPSREGARVRFRHQRGGNRVAGESPWRRVHVVREQARAAPSAPCVVEERDVGRAS